MTETACRNEYTPAGGRRRGDRIVRCHLPAGHPGEHEEADTEITWMDAAVSSPFPAAGEQATPSSDDEAFTDRVGDLIGVGIEMYYRDHQCDSALDSVCVTCKGHGRRIAPVVMATVRAAAAAREAEVRRKVADQRNRDAITVARVRGWAEATRHGEAAAAVLRILNERGGA